MRLVTAFVPIAFMLALGGCDRQSGEGAQGEANAANGALATADEVTADEVTADEVTGGAGASGAAGEFSHVVDRSKKGEAMPDAVFTDPAAKITSLAKEAGGKPLVVNLWATWCAPCIAELPALDKFAANAAGKGVKVIAVSQDDLPVEQVQSFLAARKLASLKRYHDPETALGFAYGTSLPTTVFYDKGGKEVLRVIGALDWEGPDGQALLKEIAG